MNDLVAFLRARWDEEFEIWSSDSGNRLFAAPDLAVALSWALAYWTREGDAALDVLSIGDERDRWVVSGDALRNLLRHQPTAGKVAR